jgi:hypothetical protein
LTRRFEQKSASNQKKEAIRKWRGKKEAPENDMPVHNGFEEGKN